MRPNGAVIVDGDRIKAVIPMGQAVPATPGANRVDAKGKFLVPGLIDAHVHLVHVLDFAHVTGDEVLPLFLAAGVTSVRDTGDEIVAETLVARFAAAHPETSPRVFLCSPLIDADPPIHRDIGFSLLDPEKVPAFVDEMAGWGVTTLKIYAGTGRAVGRRVIEEGHRRGFKVTAHLGPYSAQDAADDGIDCPRAHLVGLQLRDPRRGRQAAPIIGRPSTWELIAQTDCPIGQGERRGRPDAGRFGTCCCSMIDRVSQSPR